MSDLISRKQIAEEVKSLRISITGLRAGKGALCLFAAEYIKSVLKLIDEAPSVEAEPKRGNRCDFCNGKEKLILSIDGCCADEFSMADLNKWQKIRFCPLCGAKMDLEDNK